MEAGERAIDGWRERALAVEGDEFTLHVPIHVLFGEAVDVARCFEAYWKPQKDENGTIVRRGLEDAANTEGRRLTAETGSEILSLQRAAEEAHTAFLLAEGPQAESDLPAQARFALSEITAVLEWFFDDGVENESDAPLAKLGAAHAGDLDTLDALASALEDYADLAAPYREALDGLGDLVARLLDQARALAAALRDQAAMPVALSDKARAALALRNKLLTLLCERMATVRAAARFLYRDGPAVARQGKSACERKQRAAAFRGAARKTPTGASAPG
jgi:hypothetical protein